jgi:hypothetical protein
VVLQDHENDVSFPIGELVDQLMEMFLRGHRLKYVQVFVVAILPMAKGFVCNNIAASGSPLEKLSGDVAGDYLRPAPPQRSAAHHSERLDARTLAPHADHIRDGLDCPERIESAVT